MTPAEEQTFAMEQAETMRTFDVMVQHPASGKISTIRVTGHSHATDEAGHLSIATINVDGSRNVRQMFHSCRWVQLDEVGYSANHVSKLVLH